MKKKNETVYAFIDSQNVNLGVKSQGWDLDFGRFKVHRAFLFIGFIPRNKDLYKKLVRKWIHLNI